MRLAALPLLVMLSACASLDTAADTATRNSAKTAINAVLDARLPGVNAAPITDCVIDNATRGEILVFASAAVTGVTQSTVSSVVEITRRTPTLLCITKAGLGTVTL